MPEIKHIALEEMQNLFEDSQTPKSRELEDGSQKLAKPK